MEDKNFTEANVVDVIEENEDNTMIEQLKIFFSASRIDFSDEEIAKVYECARSNDRDALYMMQIISAFGKQLANRSMEPVTDKVGYICCMIEQGNFQNASNQEKSNKSSELIFAQIEEPDIEEDDNTKDDGVINIAENKNSWKKVAAVASVAAFAGTGVFLAVRQPWKAAKVVCHFVHIV